ncbi:MAG: anaerobic ribonucleoside-triphosphate reductase, partial [Desulfurococcaceae archaeon]
EYSTNTARKWMMETGVPWNVEEVPGESASPKLAMMDLKLYPELGEYLPDPENPVYSTSIAPYYAEIELPDRIEIEQRVQKYFTGGVMMHIFLGEEPDEESLVSLTKKLMQTDLVYWSYTPAITFCNTCSKTFTGLYMSCPSCGSNNVDIWSRIIGYYRPLRNWNPQRKKEFWKRHHYRL